MSRIKDSILSLEKEIEQCNQLEYELYCFYNDISKKFEEEDVLEFFTPLMGEVE